MSGNWTPGFKVVPFFSYIFSKLLFDKYLSKFLLNDRAEMVPRSTENGYAADVIVGIRSDGGAVLYDLVNIASKKITEASQASENKTVPPTGVRLLSLPVMYHSLTAKSNILFPAMGTTATVCPTMQYMHMKTAKSRFPSGQRAISCQK